MTCKRELSIVYRTTQMQTMPIKQNIISYSFYLSHTERELLLLFHFFTSRREQRTLQLIQVRRKFIPQFHLFAQYQCCFQTNDRIGRSNFHLFLHLQPMSSHFQQGFTRKRLSGCIHKTETNRDLLSLHIGIEL